MKKQETFQKALIKNQPIYEQFSFLLSEQYFCGGKRIDLGSFRGDEASIATSRKIHCANTSSKHLTYQLNSQNIKLTVNTSFAFLPLITKDCYE